MSATLLDTRTRHNRRNNTLNVWLWVAQCLLAVFFTLAGLMHALMPLAAAGLALVMLLAMPVHIVCGEVNMLSRNIAALSIAVFVVWGRTTRVRISARRVQ